MTTCIAREAHLGQADRDYISWPTTGITADGVFTVSVELERSGVRWSLAIGTNEVVGYFAGPNYIAPGVAHRVPATSHCEIHVVSADIDVTLDGGFIVIEW